MGDEGATVKWTQNFHLRALRPKFRGHAPEILTPAAQIFGSLYMTSSVTPPSSPSPTTSACAAIVAILWGLQPSSYHPRRGAAILTILWRRRPSQFSLISETINPYELQRLRLCMRNKARLDALNIPSTGNEFNNIVAALKSTTASKNKVADDSETEYDPGNDSTGEGEQSDDEAQSALTRTAKKTSLNDRNPADISPCPPTKRLKQTRHYPAAAHQTTRVTRSQKASEPGAYVHPTSILPASVFTPPESLAKGVDSTQNTAQDDAIPQQDAQGAHDQCVQHDNERDRCIRGTNMGKGLQKITRSRRAKLPLVIKEGKTRPSVPLIAAKFATESNILVRNHLPMFPHWKEYKKQTQVLDQFMGGLKLKFDMDKNDGSVKHACGRMMQSAIRQQRYRLKKKYFTPFPLHLVPKTSPVKSLTDAQWNALVEHWKNPKNVETADKNKINCSQVKFHQATGSRSFEVHLENLGDKYKDEEPNAFDLFKDFHYSKKKGYAPAVQSAINELENKLLESTDSQNEQPAVNTILAEFLAEKTKNNQFLHNVGLAKVQRTAKAQQLEEQLAAEKSANAELQLLVSKQKEQLDVLAMKFQESEQARINDKAETDKKLEVLLSRLQSS
ncbi:hypothetical protein PAHAL_4G067100 [Panicum hallii]|uniref:Uncharacterized protein n=1 Tax=Panicum hallii TaxID=206008 RepID=A0A2T8JBZ9_9POAL|nr:hypothetical protein PAHAL_4G067100 [Panicum hallii]